MMTETPPFGNVVQLVDTDRQFAMAFTSTPRGARLARRLASHRLDAWGFPYDSEVNETLTLVVGELAANAVTHGRVPGRDFHLNLTLSAARDLARVEVSDTRDERLPPSRPCAPGDPEAETGRGLWLVAGLASRLSVGPRRGGGPGKTVRVEVDLRGTAPEAGENGGMADLDALRVRFVRALEGVRGAGPDPAPYADNLLDRWREPQRRYHTVTHLTAVLDHVDALAEYAADPDLVRLAAWFHDAVYLPERSENEERSARLAERALGEAGVAAEKAAEVARLVRLTVSHDPADDDPDGQVLCDADLAILAAPPSAYAAYATAVRQEYHFVPDDAFRSGRAAVLRHLLELPRLFRTPYGRREWEATARYNLRAELEMLSPGGTPGP